MILTTKRCKNMYVVDLSTTRGDNLICLKVQDETSDLWNRRLGHISPFLLNKLVSKDMVHGLPRINFNNIKVCEACAKG